MENEPNENEKSTVSTEPRGYTATGIKIWLWIALALAVAGACLLFPIGPAAVNVCFLIIKVGMIVGLLMMLFKGSKSGFWIWVVCSALAVVMTIMKWAGAGETTFLYVSAVIIDILMPVVAGIMESHQEPKTE